MIFEKLLQESVRTHGHLCAGQVLGVRMSMRGLGEVGIGEPRGKDRKKVIVFVEMDRCATDAVQSVTGCSLGKRTMKFRDYGKMAASFLNLQSGRAVRVMAREDARQKAKQYFPEIRDKYAAQVEAYKVMKDEELFDVREVQIRLGAGDMPGRPQRKVPCAVCGEYVQDMREIRIDGEDFCRACAEGGYYSSPGGVDLSGVMHTRHNGIGIRSKLWIDKGGEAVFGRGRRFLLEAIDTYGSINQAAKEINIPYRKAWSYIKAMEERLGIVLVERRAGGRHGGGASLTEEARDFLKRYKALESGIRQIVDERFGCIFTGGSGV